MTTKSTAKCPICGEPYAVYAFSAADQSACPSCVRKGEHKPGAPWEPRPMSAGQRERFDADECERILLLAREGLDAPEDQAAIARLLAALRAREGDGVGVEDARSAYMNARTCICGRDASEHVIINHVSRAYTCAGFDPDWESIRSTLECAQAHRPAPQPAPEAGEVEKALRWAVETAVRDAGKPGDDPVNVDAVVVHALRTLSRLHAPPVTTEVDDGE